MYGSCGRFNPWKTTGTRWATFRESGHACLCMRSQSLKQTWTSSPHRQSHTLFFRSDSTPSLCTSPCTCALCTPDQHVFFHPLRFSVCPSPRALPWILTPHPLLQFWKYCLSNEANNRKSTEQPGKYRTPKYYNNTTNKQLRNHTAHHTQTKKASTKRARKSISTPLTLVFLHKTKG